VLRDETESANAASIEAMSTAEPRSYIGWAAQIGFTAMGSRMLGNHDVARQLCDVARRHMTDADRDYPVLFLSIDVESAWSDALAGHPDRALQQIDALLQRYAERGNPLVSGQLHEARALIAHEAGLEREFVESAIEAEALLRPTGNPALIAKCERLAQLRRRERAPSGRRHSAQVNRWLEMLAGYAGAERRLAQGVELARQVTQARAAALYRRQGDTLRLAAQTEQGGFPETADPDVEAALQGALRERSASAVRGQSAGHEISAQLELVAGADGRARRAQLVATRAGSRDEEVLGVLVLTLERGSVPVPAALLFALAESSGWDDATVAEVTRSLPPGPRALS
jgi:hypothetical protein